MSESLSKEYHVAKEYHVGSAIVLSRPECVADLCQQIEYLPDCEVFTHSEKGKIVVIIETQDTYTISERLSQIEQLAGVLSVQMVYHQVEALKNGEFADGY